MRSTRSSLCVTFVFLAGATIATGACGPNVILDAASTSTGVGGAGGSTGPAFGGSTTTSSFAPGAGGGVSVAVTTTVGTGGGFSGPTTVTVGTGGGFSVVQLGRRGDRRRILGRSSVAVGTATSTGSGMGACTDTDDGPSSITVIYPAIVQCASEHPGDVGAELKCVQNAAQVGVACGNCLVDYIQCSLQACLSECSSNPNGTSCESCRNQNCSSAYTACSGFAYAPGSTTCNEVLVDGVKGTGWQSHVPGQAFVTGKGFYWYGLLEQCACQTFAPSGCETACDNAFSNGPPDLCDGYVASPQCLTCLESTCGNQFMSCTAN